MPALSRFLLLILLMVPLPLYPQTSDPAGLSWEPYSFRSFDGQEHKGDLGRLRVPENRRARSSRMIQIAFLRLPSTAEKPGAPIVFLAGGPGVPGSVMAKVPVYYRLFAELQRVGDVILLDQRGTGMSDPNLECVTGASLPLDVFSSEAAAVRGLVATTRICTAQARAKGADLAGYTTEQSADDLEDLRAALGVDRLNLLGFSYGTALAQAYVARHPQGIGRVVFAATGGPEDALKLPAIYDLQLHRLLLLAAQSDPWKSADLDAIARQAFARLARPMPLTVTDKRTGKPVELRVGKVALQTVLQARMNNARTLDVIPALLASVAQGDPALFQRQVEELYNSLSGGVSSMTMAMICAAPTPPARRARVAQEASRALLGDAANLQLRPEVCAAIAVRPQAPRAPLWTTAPALFLSGTLDGNAPPFQAEQVRWGFPNSVHVIVENAGHESLPAKEVQALMADFFRGTDVSGRQVRLDPPQFPSVEEAKAALRQPPRR